MLGTKRAVCAELSKPYHTESSMYANTTYNIISHSQILLLVFLLLEDLPIYLPYLYIIAYYYTIISFKIKTEKATAFYLVNTDHTKNLVSFDNYPIAAAEQCMDPYDLCSALQHCTIAQYLTHIMNSLCSSLPQQLNTSSLLSSLFSAAQIWVL